MTSILILVILYLTFIDLHMLNYSWITGMKIILSWCMIFLMCSWVPFVNILLRMGVCVCWFWYQCNPHFMAGLSSVPFLFILWNSLRRVLAFLQRFGRIWRWTYLVLGFFLCWNSLFVLLIYYCCLLCICWSSLYIVNCSSLCLFIIVIFSRFSTFVFICFTI